MGLRDLLKKMSIFGKKGTFIKAVATSFLGKMVFSYFQKKNKEKINTTISDNGLDADGSALINGSDGLKEFQMVKEMSQNRASRE